MNRIAINIQKPTTELTKDDSEILHKYQNGDSYKGQLLEGVKEGEGLYRFKNGDFYKGNFENNNFHGKGTYTTSNGDIYTGAFLNSLAEGFGMCNFLTIDQIESYEGKWYDNCATGKGTLVFSMGDRYEGGFNNGRFEGKGVMLYSNGDAFDGAYSNGVVTGEGTYKFKDAKVVQARRFQNGVDRANTAELKKSTYKIKQKKKAVKKVSFEKMGKRTQNPNLDLMGDLLGEIGMVGIKRAAKNKKARVNRRVKEAKSIQKRKGRKNRVEIGKRPRISKKKSKKSTKVEFGLDYLKTKRCWDFPLTKRMEKKGIDIEDIFEGETDFSGIRRMNTIEVTMKNALEYFRISEISRQAQQI